MKRDSFKFISKFVYNQLKLFPRVTGAFAILWHTSTLYAIKNVGCCSLIKVNNIFVLRIYE